MILKLLQWNILYDEDIDKVCDFIKRVDPDIACLQEITKDSPNLNDGIDSVDFLSKELGLYSTSKMAQTYDHPKYGKVTLGNAILSKKKPTNYHHTYLQDSATQNISPQNEGRIYIEATFRMKNRSFTIGTTHLAYVPWFKEKPFKRKEWNKLLQKVDRHKDNYILAGDLNAVPDGTLINELSDRMINTGPDTSENTFTTKPFDLHGFKVDDLEYRLDYVFATPDLKIVDSAIRKTDVSDHLPIVVRLEL